MRFGARAISTFEVRSNQRTADRSLELAGEGVDVGRWAVSVHEYDAEVGRHAQAFDALRYGCV